MTNADLIVVNATLLQLNAGLLGLAVMLLSLVPALLVAVDQKQSGYLHGEKGKVLIEGGLLYLRRAMVLFAVGCLVGIIGFFYLDYQILLVVGGLAAGIGLALITLAAFRFARISRFLVRGRNI